MSKSNFLYFPICPKCGFTARQKDFRGNRTVRCLNCNKEFLKQRSDQKYCSSKCRGLRWAFRKGKKYFAKAARKSRLRRKIIKELELRVRK